MDADSVTDGRASDVERAVLGVSSAAAVLARLSDFTRQHLGTGIDSVLFRAGRIDVAWGVRLDDGRQAVLKVHRRPVDPEQLRLTAHALTVLSGLDFPCPAPLSEVAAVDGRRSPPRHS